MLGEGRGRDPPPNPYTLLGTEASAYASISALLGFTVYFLWTPAQRSLSEVYVIFCQCFICLFIFFMAALMLRPW